MSEVPTAIGSQRYNLRPYQTQLLDDTRAKFAAGKRSIIVMSPTGSGKTILFCSVVDGAVRRGKRCLVLTHRREIAEQTSEALVGFAVPHGIVMSGTKPAPGWPVQVASISTLVHRLDEYSDVDLLVIDEAHHSTARTWRRVIDAMPRARILGTSATPERSDGAGLGDIFEEMIEGPDTAWLIGAGFLAPYTAYAPTEAPDLSRIATRAGDFASDQLADIMAQPVVVGSAVEAYRRHANGRRAVVFAVDIRHSQALAERFKEAGIVAVHLDAETPRDERRRILAALASGEIQVVSNCDLISEGLDVPSIDAVLLARPTQSTGLYLQQVGRSLRVAPGKDRAIVLDLVGNISRHGLPDAPREWSLEAKPRKQRIISKRWPRCCEACATMNKPHAITCTTCGNTLVTPVERMEIETELARINRELIVKVRRMDHRQALTWAGQSEKRLQQVAMAKGYKPGWVWHALEEALA